MSVLANRKNLHLLGALPARRRAVVEAVDGGRVLQARLADLGIVRGTEVIVISNIPGGPVLVEVRGTRYSLGRGMVDRISVR